MKKRNPPGRPSLLESGSSLLGIDQATDEKILTYEQGLIRLLQVGERLRGKMQGVAEYLCQEVAQITRGQVQLSLHCRETAVPSPQQSSPTGTISIPFQFGDLNYGTLYVQNDPVHPTQPIIPSVTVHLLRLICSSILHDLENSALLQFQYQHLESQETAKPLTSRQREILNFLCRGYDLETIARILNIELTTVDSHRQRIYEKLQVHSRQEMLLVAFRTGLFSPLEGVSGIRPHF